MLAVLMTPERWKEVKDLFAAAIELPADARGAFLSAKCMHDEELRTSVERLLASHVTASDFIEGSPVRGLSAAVASQGRLTGATRGGYRLGARVGAGGTGEVYEGWDIRTGRRVAIKVLHEDGADSARRLTREARHALELAHPNICEVYEVISDDASAFIAMEFLEGRVLSDAVPDGGFSASETTDLAVQLAEAIAHAHAHSMVHRDLKCANLMLQPDGHLKVLDFGLSRRLPAAVESAVSAASMTDTGVIAGTISYLAPEVLKGDRADARSDIWACGIILHELLTGQQPFDGRTPFALTSAVLREPPHPLPSSVPSGLRAIRDNCLAKDPADRYQHGGEFLAAIQAYRGGGRVKHRVRRHLPGWIPVGIALGAVVIGAVAVGFMQTERHGTDAQRKASIAVLQLRGTVSGQEPSYFSDGITEALIARLGTIDGIRVLSRTSTSRYRDVASLASVRRELDADVAVRGSVESAANRVRLTVELVDTATDRSLWGGTFERNANEVLALENDAVRAIVDHVGVDVSPSDRTMLRVARAVDPVVYEDYLKGRFYWNKRTNQSLEQAVRFYQSSIERDPTYAPAHAALADCYNQLGTVMVGTASPAEMRPRARAEAIAAIQADDSLAEAHATLGYISHYDWDWATAEREFKRAIDLNPNLALAHAWYANYLVSRRRLPEAVIEVQRAEQLDPFSLVIVTNVGWTLAYARRPDEAIAAYRRALALDPGYIQARWRLAYELTAVGRFDDAVAEATKVTEVSHRNASSLSSLGQVYARTGRRADAMAALNELLELSRSQYVSPVSVYALYFLLGDFDNGFGWLEKAIHERSNGVAYLPVDEFMEPVRDDPRYRSVLARIGLTDAR